MTTLFPGSQDDFANPLGTDGLATFGHAALHSNVNDAIEAIEAAIGTPDVVDPTSITARLEALEAGGGGVADHGALTGLADDDHSQYHTDARGDARYAPIGKGVTNGDSHDHSGGDGAQIAYSGLSGLPTLGTAAALNVGIAATNVVQLDGSAKPA